MANPTVEKRAEQLYASDLEGFVQTYKEAKQAETLPGLQQRWFVAAQEAAKNLGLHQEQFKAVLRVPGKKMPVEAAAIAKLKTAPEIFYRMSLFSSAAAHLTAALQNDKRRAQHWMMVQHGGGPFQGKRPIAALISGAPHTLKTLQSYVHFA